MLGMQSVSSSMCSVSCRGSRWTAAVFTPHAPRPSMSVYISPRKLCCTAPRSAALFTAKN